PGLALEEQRPPHRDREVDRCRETAIREVRLGREGALDLLDRSEFHLAIVGRGNGSGRGVSSPARDGTASTGLREGGGNPCIPRSSSTSRPRVSTRRSTSSGA